MPIPCPLSASASLTLLEYTAAPILSTPVFTVWTSAGPYSARRIACLPPRAGDAPVRAAAYNTTVTVLLGGPSPAMLTATTTYSHSLPRSWPLSVVPQPRDMPASVHASSVDRRRWMR